MESYRLLSTLPDVNGKTIIVRFDFNVPIVNGKVSDDYRIKKSLPTLAFLLKKGAKVIIISHIESEPATLLPVFEYLKPLMPIAFCKDILKEGANFKNTLKAGDVVLAENIRMYEGEKKNDEQFTKTLASFGDFYVNDAFSVSHRPHASVIGIPKFLKGFLGLQFEEEIKNLSTCFSPNHPFLFILGGAKFDTKLPLVNKFLPIADAVFIGGALADDVFKVRGFKIGKSLSDDSADLSTLSASPKVIVPSDVVVRTDTGKRVTTPEEIKDEEAIVDAGPQTVKGLKTLIDGAKHILWNGPLGNYENGFKEPTLEVAKMLAEATHNGAKTIIGGGDTLAAIVECKLPETAFSFVSTGGGAMLDYLANGTLPGLEALK